MADGQSEDILTSLVYKELSRRHEYSSREIESLTEIANRRWLELASRGGDRLGIPNISERACIYITGSLARLEATEGSDLDLFVVDHIDADSIRLNYVENAHLISTLDQIRLEAGFRPFSRGGEFVHTHSLQDIVTRTGSPSDDATNTFTARILLLLNSTPLLNEPAYAAAKKAVLDRYWQTSDPEKRIYPVMLMNDIRRWWGVVGLNFEMYNPKEHISSSGTYSTTPKREIANLKLRYARMLACYSPLLGFLHESDPRGLSRLEVERILAYTPVERLTYVFAATRVKEAKEIIDRILRSYDDYLTFMREPEEDLIEIFKSPARRRVVKQKAYEFHSDMSILLRVVGEGNILLDYMLV